MNPFDKDAATNEALFAHCRAELETGADPLAVVVALFTNVKLGRNDLHTGKTVGLTWGDALTAVFGPADGAVRTAIRQAWGAKAAPASE